ncbi:MULTISPECIES: TetR/AcrR family transcriptional regulator [unclassified Streptomyces]|uniref:TetR/AcrR family transcriptional regulator n=1 Tax=unclassified Streptomyces TaxID=2593676 RepID=UPI00225C1E51|nr:MULTISPECIES: TetR/AcrR family transcriptional regulator [unclassified Streptomyces]MCX5310021.1 TetR/AcrR family transcriptional regulator [Streptomyces sp. NBC_00154]
MATGVKSPEPEEPSSPAQEPAKLSRRRRQPVQARSRETVERILDAAAALLEEGGVDAVTTRAIAERADITAPSLYRFFADREQVLDALMEQHLERLGAFLAEAEADWSPSSPAEFVERELGSYVAYFQSNPNAARLWLDGRVSPTVRAEVLRYQRSTAQHLHDVAVAAGLAAPQTELLVFVMMVELGDRVLDLAFRDGREADPDVVRHGRIALTAYVEAAMRP